MNEEKTTRSAEKPKIFKGHAQIDFLYDFLNAQIADRILLYGTEETIVKKYFEKVVEERLTSPAMHRRIRDCLAEGVHAAQFIASQLIQAIKAYILEYNDDLITREYEIQMELSQKEFSLVSIIDQFIEIRNQAQRFIKKLPEEIIGDTNPILKKSWSKWSALISTGEKNLSVTEKLRMTQFPEILQFSAFIVTVYFCMPYYLKYIFYPVINSLLARAVEDSQKMRELLDTRTSEHVQDDVNVAFIGASIIFLSLMFMFAKRNYQSLTFQTKKSFAEILLLASENYWVAYPPTPKPQLDIRDILPPRPSISIPAAVPAAPAATGGIKDFFFKRAKIFSREYLQQPKRRSHIAEIKQHQAEKDQIDRHRVEVHEYKERHYLRLKNLHHQSTGRYLMRPSSPVEEIVKVAFNLIKDNPVELAPSSKGQAGLKRLGTAELRAFPGCVDKVKFFQPPFRRSRMGVSRRLPNNGEKQALRGCTEILEMQPKIIVTKRGG